MTPEDNTYINKWCAGKSDLTFTLATAPNAKGEQMAGFCDDLKDEIAALKVKKESDETGFSTPAMIVGRHNNIAFQALPSGKLLRLFLSAIDTPPIGAADKDNAPNALLQQIDLPVTLKLYVAPQCPHCPGTLKALLSLSASSHHLRLTVVDAQHFVQEAQADQVRSVPTLILDEQFRWSGPMDLQEVLTMAIQRDPAQLSAASLRQLIEDGQAPRVAQMMAEAGVLFPALMDLLTHERWSVRLGAMVTAEYLADDAEPLAHELAKRLWDQFGQLSDPVKGDVVHVIGLVNTETTRGYLDHVRSGPFDEAVKEAASEALDEMA